VRKKFNSLKARAKKRNLPVTISFEQYSYMKKDDCYYCGISNLLLQFYCEMLKINTPWMTIDRKNNDLGYLQHNVVSACFLCNKIKGSFFTVGEMKEIGERYVAPKFKIFEDDVMDSFEDWCVRVVSDDDDDYRLDL